MPIDEDTALLTLTQWLSPAFPVSGYAYSHGLEAAVSRGHVSTAEDSRRWIGTVVSDGSGRTDAVLLCHALRDGANHEALNDLALSLSASRERHDETLAQGRAFTKTVNALTGRTDPPLAMPLAVGRAAAGLGLPAERVAALYLQAFAGNLVSVAVRFIPLGQTVGQGVLQALRPLILATATRAAATPLDKITASAFGADLAAMEHETLDVRIYRS